MTPDLPQYLLFTEALRSPQGRVWRFLLLKMGTSHSIDASDVEADSSASRTELLALVRGLEAIEEPARVKLVTGSRYLQRGLARGIATWSADDWHWERFGRRVPVRDADLWRRVSRALEFHQLDCHTWTVTVGASPEATAPREVATVTAPPSSDEPAVLVVRQTRARRPKGNSVVDNARQTITGVRRGFETLWNAELAPTG